MKQPELGLAVADNRLRAGLTQEQLAESCDVSTRTIQRIENGEVDPRPFTRTRLSEVLEFDFGSQNDENETLWLALLHLSSCVCILLIPLIIWSWKKKRSLRIAQDGRIVLNFQITMTLILFTALILLLVLPPLLFISQQNTMGPIRLMNMLVLSCTILPFFAVGFYCFIQGIRNTLRMLSDKPASYPLSIPFIR